MCHQGKETPGRNGELQSEPELYPSSSSSYVSLWSGNYKMAVFSAAVIEKQKKDLPARGKWRQHEPKGLDPSVDFFADLGMFSDFEKGHLFPYGYAKDADQGWATMTTANAVPQDRVFNQGVWSAVESHVKEYINDCHHRDRQMEGYKAILVTGAVPDYFGKGTSDTEFRVKKTKKNQIGDKPASRADPVPHFDPNRNHGIDEELEDGLTVPTHMWTQFVCVQPRTMTVRSRVSLIGLNYRTGIVKRYGAETIGITATLKTMYKNSEVGEYSSSVKMEQSEQERIILRHAKNFAMNHNKVCHQQERLDHTSMRCTSDKRSTETSDAQFWNNVNVKEIRRKNEHNRLGYLLAQF
jgi:hypothetical protein